MSLVRHADAALSPWDDGPPLTKLAPRGFNWASGHALTVLLIGREREAELKQLLRATLIAIGPKQAGSTLTVRVAESADDALEQVERENPHLVVVAGGGALAQRLLRYTASSLLILPEQVAGADQQSGDSILVPVDFSSESRAAALFALDLAQARGLTPPSVELTHVYAVTPGYTRAGWTYEEFAQRLCKAAEEQMREFVDSLHVDDRPSRDERSRPPEVSTSCRLSVHPANTVLEMASHRPYGQMVIGSRPRTRLTGLLPHFTNRVVLSSPIPTWIVRDAVPTLGLVEALWYR